MAAPAPLTEADVRRVVTDALTNQLGTVGSLRLEKYDGEISWKCIDWMNNFEEITKIKGWTDQNRVDRFAGSLDKDAKNWYKLYVVPTVPAIADWNTLKTMFINYHLPKDKDTYALEQMNNRKQKAGEDVVKYVTHKHLLCREVNNAMAFDEIKRHVLEGISPEIKATLVHKDNPNMDRLIENAKNIEQGLRLLPNLSNQNDYKERLIANENNIKALCDGMTKLLSKVAENEKDEKTIDKRNIDFNRNEYRRDFYRRGDDRRDERRRDRSFSRDRQSNGTYSRDQSRDRYENRDRYRFREPSFERRDSFERRNNDRSGFDDRSYYRNRSPFNDRSPNNNYYNRNRSYDKDKRNEFDLARDVSNTRNLEGEPICYLCKKPGHHAKFCPKNQFVETLPPQRKAYFINSGFSNIVTMMV